MPTRRQFLTAAGTGIATWVGGCSAVPSHEEQFDPLAPTSLDEFATAQFRGGLENRGYTDVTVPDRVRVDWSLPVNRGDHTAAKSTPVAVGERDLVIAGDTGILRRVSADEDIEWGRSVTSATRGIHGTPAVANETVYVGAYDGALYAFDLTTGERKWRTQLGDAIGSSPVYYNGVCYIAVEFHEPDGSVAAVDAATGEVRWRDSRPTDHPHSTIGLVLDAGFLIVGSNDGRCYAWSFPELDRAWVFETGGAIKGPVAIHDGLAIFGSWDNHVYGVHLDDGSEAWSFAADDDVMSAPAIGPAGTAYVGSHDHTLYALDSTDGSENWRFDTGGYIIGAITRTPDYVLAGSYDTNFYAVDASTGREEWHVSGRGHATSGTLVRDDALYYAGRATDAKPGQLYRVVGHDTGG